MPALCYAPSLLTLLIKVVSRVLQLQSIYVGINIRSNNVQTLYNGNDALGKKNGQIGGWFHEKGTVLYSDKINCI